MFDSLHELPSRVQALIIAPLEAFVSEEAPEISLS
jgi:hypothetical protein